MNKETKCPNCGNDNMLEGADESGNSHEWLCYCGYHRLEQGNRISEIMWK